MAQFRALITITVVVFLAGIARAQVIHVDDDAPSGGDGASWQGAFRHLQDALGVAQPGDEVRVGGGVYRTDRSAASPGGSGDRDATFDLVDGVSIIGGWAGLAGPDPDVRDPDLYVTVLSGDLKGDDDGSCDALAGDDAWPCSDDNAFHVVQALVVGASARLESVVITGGRAVVDGAGITCLIADPTFVDCDVVANRASLDGGGGVHLFQSSPTFLDCRITGNASAGDFGAQGGGVAIDGGAPLFDACLIADNVATTRGGGVHALNSAAVFTACTISGCVSQFGGGVSVDGGAPSFAACTIDSNVAVEADEFHPGDAGGAFLFGTNAVLEGCTISNNVSDRDGGGVLVRLGGAPQLLDCTIIGNHAESRGGGLSSRTAKTLVSGGLMAGNSAVVLGGAVDLVEAGTLTGVAISGNVSETDGGGVHLRDAVSMIGCTLDANTCGDDGGGGFVTGEGPTIASCAFTGNTAGDDGGALRIEAAIDVVLSATDFDSNTAGDTGGAVFEAESGVHYEGCAFAGNQAEFGGALASEASSSSLATCHFEANTAIEDGGAIDALLGTLALVDCTVTDNVAGACGAGVHAMAAQVDLVNGTVTRGEAADGGGLCLTIGSTLHAVGAAITMNEVSGDGGGIALAASNATLENVEVRSNTADGAGGGAHATGGALVATGTIFEINGSGAGGGAIFLEQATCDLRACTLKDDVSDGPGGGIGAIDGVVTIATSLVRTNGASSGGGVHLDGGSATIFDTRFLGNSALDGDGGAIAIVAGATSVGGAVFNGNVAAANGGAISVGGEGTLAVACASFTANGAAAGGAVYSGGTATIDDSVLWNDGPDEIVDASTSAVLQHCVVDGGWSGAGAANVDADPLFLDPLGPDGQAGSEDDDLRLAAGSPAVDAGANDLVPSDGLDIDGNGVFDEPLPLDVQGAPRFVDDPAAPDTGAPPGAILVDIGAYERQSPCPADVNGDGAVNVEDLVLVLTNWGEADSPADIDGNGTVDVNDLVAVITTWGGMCVVVNAVQLGRRDRRRHD